MVFPGKGRRTGGRAALAEGTATRACPTLPVPHCEGTESAQRDLPTPWAASPESEGLLGRPHIPYPRRNPYLQARSPRALVTLQRRPVGLSPMLPTTASRTYCLRRHGLLREGLECPPTQPGMEIPAKPPSQDGNPSQVPLRAHVLPAFHALFHKHVPVELGQLVPAGERHR